MCVPEYDTTYTYHDVERGLEVVVLDLPVGLLAASRHEHCEHDHECHHALARWVDHEEVDHDHGELEPVGDEEVVVPADSVVADDSLAQRFVARLGVLPKKPLEGKDEDYERGDGAQHEEDVCLIGVAEVWDGPWV